MPAPSEPPLPRHQFPITDRLCYLNHAGVGPLPQVAVDAITASSVDYRDEGGRAWARSEELDEQVRVQAARLMGVPADDVAFVKNTTEGLGFVASGLDWNAGDRVVTANREFPSTVYPWLNLRDLDVTVDLVEPVGEGLTLPIDLLAEAIAAAPTRLVVLSWVQFGRGWRTDLAALSQLCKDHGALLCVDVIQGLGVIPAELERWGVDFASADSHKWMLGPHGIGVFYVAERCREMLRPLEPGWLSVSHRDDFDNLELVYDDSARRFEGGSPNVITIAGMGASIDLLLDAGVENVWAHVDGLCDRLVDGLSTVGARVLSDRSPEGRSAIVTFDVPGTDSEVLAERLDTEGVVCSPRGGGIRVAPHGYNTADEIDSMVDLVRRLTA